MTMRSTAVPLANPRLDVVESTLVVLYLLGLYLGAAVSLWLRRLGAPSVLYWRTVWVILGQASGSYVGPKTWSVLLIAAGASILRVGAHQKFSAATLPMAPTRPLLRFFNPPPGYLGS